MKKELISFIASTVLVISLTGFNQISSAVNDKAKPAESTKTTEKNTRSKKTSMAKIINNGSKCLQYNNKVYYSCGYGTDICFDLNTKKVERISTQCAGDSLYAYKNGVYLNQYADNSSFNSIMRFDINTKKVSCSIPNAVILYCNFDKNFKIYYCKKIKNKFMLCSANADGLNVKTLFASDTIEISDAYKADGKLYFTGEYRGEKLLKVTPSFIFTLSKNFSSINQISKDSMKDCGNDGLYIEHITYANGWIYYAVGNTEGTGQYYYGHIYRIKPDGSNKKQIARVSSSDFNIQNGFIYYDNVESKYPESWAYRHIANIDGTKVKEYNGPAGAITFSNNKYIYRYGSNKKDFNYFYRTDKNGSNPKTLITIHDKINDSTKQNMLGNVYVIGNWIYYTINNQDVSEHYGDRILTNFYTFNRIKIDGTHNELLYKQKIDEK